MLYYIARKFRALYLPFCSIEFGSTQLSSLMNYWKQYNERLVFRDEIFISKDVVNDWDKELAITALKSFPSQVAF